MLVADYSNEAPEINFETHYYAYRSTADLQIGEVQFTLREVDSEEVFEIIDKGLHTETRKDLEDKIESLDEEISDLNEEVSDLKAELENSKSYIEQLEAKIEKFKQYIETEKLHYAEIW